MPLIRGKMLEKTIVGISQLQSTNLYSTALSGNALNLGIDSKTTTYVMSVNDATILADATAGGFTVTLPPAQGNKGHLVSIKKIDSSGNTVTVAASTLTATDLIDGTTTKPLSTQWSSLQLQVSGNSWYIL